MYRIGFASKEQINEYFRDQIETISQEYSDAQDSLQKKFRQDLEKSRDAKEFALAFLENLPD